MEPAQPPLGRSIASAAVVIGGGLITSRVLGLVREQVIAALFGSTGPTSAFRTATRVTTGFYDLLLAGATTSALVPVFSDYAGSGRNEELSRVASTFVNLAVVVLGVIVAVLVLAAPLVVGLLGTDPAQFELAVELTRIALPSIVLLGTASILTAVLYARRSFTLPALARPSTTPASSSAPWPWPCPWASTASPLGSRWGRRSSSSCSCRRGGDCATCP